MAIHLSLGEALLRIAIFVAISIATFYSAATMVIGSTET